MSILAALVALFISRRRPIPAQNAHKRRILVWVNAIIPYRLTMGYGWIRGIEWSNKARRRQEITGGIPLGPSRDTRWAANQEGRRSRHFPRQRPHAGSILAQRRRRWASVGPGLIPLWSWCGHHGQIITIHAGCKWGQRQPPWLLTVIRIRSGKPSGVTLNQDMCWWVTSRIWGKWELQKRSSYGNVR